jgi:hypothetical protein
MSWQDASIAITGTFLVIVLGSVLIREILKTAQLVLAVNGQIRLEDQYRQSRSASAAALRPAAKSRGVNRQVEPLKMTNGEDA